MFTLFCTPFIYRAYKINSVPDIEYPFDKEVFLKSLKVDPSENALADFQKAISLCGAQPEVDDLKKVFEEIRSGKITTQETKDVIAFLDANQSAINAWREETRKDKFREVPFEEFEFSTYLTVSDQSILFIYSMLLEAEQKILENDEKEAIALYLDSFRTSLLIAKGHTPFQRQLAIQGYTVTSIAFPTHIA